MIEFKIIVAPDKSQQSTYQHLGNQLTFGQTEGDMLIDDPALAPLQIRVFAQGQGFFLENLDEDIEIRLNGRPFENPAPLKERDSISMGRTTVSFSRLDLNPPTPPEPFQHPQAASRFVEGSREKAILDALEHLEKSSSAGMPKPPPLPGAGGPPKPPPLPKKGSP